ncbi:MAG: hypothetical protein NZ741_12550, partial [Armatimonadetes bacterium]|nr:hypothetical protein [Armatimonadota bacterium]
LKNLYRPLFLRERFDALMGNPPWIAFRYLEAPYQAFLRRLIVEGYGLLSGRGELITHLEIATLFLLRAADLYLKVGGQVGFVMPRSLFHADQHDALRRGQYRLMERPEARLRLVAVWDCERVEPLFSVPCCVVWGHMSDAAGHMSGATGQMSEFAFALTPVPSPSGRGESSIPPLLVGEGSEGWLPAGQGGEGIHALILSARLPRKNASWQEAQAVLQVQPTRFYLHTRGKRSYWSVEPPTHGEASANPYRERFRQGATLVPRTFWFVQLQ